VRPTNVTGATGHLVVCPLLIAYLLLFILYLLNLSLLFLVFSMFFMELPLSASAAVYYNLALLFPFVELRCCICCLRYSRKRDATLSITLFFVHAVVARISIAGRWASPPVPIVKKKDRRPHLSEFFFIFFESKMCQNIKK
jgi:hypothetical protein